MPKIFEDTIDKIFQDQSKKNKRAILTASIGIIIFIVAIIILPFRDDLFNLLYPKPISKAVSEITHIGTLDDFYSGMQLQGNLAGNGQGIIQIPDYLLGNDIEYKRRTTGSNLPIKEIPFVSYFSINTFLGGPSAPRTLDYVVRMKTGDICNNSEGNYPPDYQKGTLCFRPKLLVKRLEKYFDAGYKPSNIIIHVGLTPLDLITTTATGSAYRYPPENMDEWSEVVTQMAIDLKNLRPNDADEFTFKGCPECDGPVNFAGTEDQLFEVYKRSYLALRSQFANPKFGLGEFTGIGECLPVYKERGVCVYDTRDLLERAETENLFPAFVPRSLHTFYNFRPDLPPSRWIPVVSPVVTVAFDSYDRLKHIAGVVPEIHQFGFLYQPFSKDLTSNIDGNNEDNLQLNWHFQVLMGFKAKLQEIQMTPQRIFHWGAMATLGDTHFINGIGYLRMVLDRYLGSEMFLLSATSTFRPDGTLTDVEVVAVAMEGQKKAILLSTFDASTPSASIRENVTITLPASMFGNGIKDEWKIIRYDPTETVFAQMKKDLRQDGNLRDEFDELKINQQGVPGCWYCTAGPGRMIKDVTKARAMIANNWNKNTPEGYINIMKKTLNFRKLEATDAAFLTNQSAIQLQRVVANEFIVLERNTPPTGGLGVANCQVISGYACDLDDYDTPLDIHFYDGPAETGTHIGQTTSSLPGGQGVANLCGGNFYRNFSFNTPDSVKDGQPHQIYTYATNIPSGPNQLLTNSSRTITCVGPTPSLTPTLTPTRTPTPTLTPVPGDTTPPSIPANLVSVSVTSNQVTLSWSASTDNVGVRGYRVYRNNIQIANITTLAPTLTYGDGTVLPSTTYQYTVRAYDATNNLSSPSTTLTINTPAPSSTLGTLTGTISSSTGGTIRRARVSISSNSGKQISTPTSQGIYTIPNLDPNITYRLRASSRGYVNNTDTFSLTTGQTLTKNISLIKR